MACGNSCEKEPVAQKPCSNTGSNSSNAYVIVLVLYILLAIIIGSCLF